jgi:hypothetical protein
MSIQEQGRAPDARYLQLLRKEIALYQALADLRAERNDLNDAKMRAWHENRLKVSSNKEFEELWLQANSPGVYDDIDRREHNLRVEIARTRTLLDHLKFAGLGDVDEQAA